MNQQSLSQVSPGRRVRLVSIQGDRVLTRRLLALGLSVGNEVEVLHRRNGDVVVGKEGNRLALGHNIADRVLIEELPR
ncbi:FeoA family protein [Thiolapillus sp.]